MNREKNLEGALAAACTFLIKLGYFTKEDFTDINSFTDIEGKIMLKVKELFPNE